MKCTDEELEERKQKQKEAQKIVDAKIAEQNKAHLDNIAKLKAEADAKKAAVKPKQAATKKAPAGKKK